MTQFSDFPSDVQAIAAKAHDEFADSRCQDSLGVIIARSIMADRLVRQPKRFGGLTANQKRVLEYLASFIAQHGIAPSYDEIRVHFDLASKSAVHRVIGELEERGAIQRLPNRSRAITIIANPN